MVYTKKWREPEVDPVGVSFPCGMKVREILGYPHAGNDVFLCIIDFQREIYEAIVKIERQVDGNIENEWITIDKLKDLEIKTPEVITYGHLDHRAYIATKICNGQRLSQILNKYEQEEVVEKSLKYMRAFGENLGKIHRADIFAKPVNERRFHTPLSMEKSVEIGQEHISDWLEKNKPSSIEKCFIHGDHHYANILWDENKTPTTLDWELSGIGWKEFDLAWALTLRPSQKFMKSQCEGHLFLEGYRLHNSYDQFQLAYCMVMIYQYFYIIGKNMGDLEYMNYISLELERLTSLGNTTL